MVYTVRDVSRIRRRVYLLLIYFSYSFCVLVKQNVYEQT